MRKEMSMNEILSTINLMRKKLGTDDIELRLSKSRNQNLFVTTYNQKRDVNESGIPLDECKETIQSNIDSYSANISNLIKMIMVKEYVNATHYLEIPNPDWTKEGTVKLSIAEILTLKSDTVKKYYESLYQVMTNEYNSAVDKVNANEKVVLTEQNITNYVQKMAELKNEKTTGKSGDPVYEAYAKEYIDNNRVLIYDPCDIKNKITKLENWISDFYNTIGYKLSEFNSLTKVWVDLDLDQDFWGYVE